jgi:hypothetical protein
MQRPIQQTIQKPRQQTIQIGNNKKVVQKGVFYDNSSILKQGTKQIKNNDTGDIEVVYTGQFYQQKNQLKGDRIIPKLKEGKVKEKDRLIFDGKFRQDGSYLEGTFYTYTHVGGINFFVGTFNRDNTLDVGVVYLNGKKWMEGKFYPGLKKLILEQGIVYDLQNGMKKFEGKFRKDGSYLEGILYTTTPKGVNKFVGTFNTDNTYNVGVLYFNRKKWKEGEFYPGLRALKRGIIYDVENGMKRYEGEFEFNENEQLIKKVEVNR